MNSLCNVTEADVVACTDAAQDRVVLLAPGLSMPVSEALSRAWKRIPADNVSVIIDTDPEVCRLGYGTIDALKAAQKSAAENGQLIAHQPGIRLCVLIADQNTLVFSPTPHLIESDSKEPEHPNGIVLKAPPEALANDLGVGPDADATRTIGIQRIDEKRSRPSRPT